MEYDQGYRRRIPLSDVEVYSAKNGESYKVVVCYDSKHTKDFESEIKALIRDVKKGNRHGVVRFEKDLFLNGHCDFFAAFSIFVSDDMSMIDSTVVNKVVMDEVIFTENDLQYVKERMRSEMRVGSRGSSSVGFEMEYFNDGICHTFTQFEILSMVTQGVNEYLSCDIDRLQEDIGSLNVSKKENGQANITAKSVVETMDKENYDPAERSHVGSVEKEDVAPLTPISKSIIDFDITTELDGYEPEGEDDDFDEDEQDDVLAPLPISPPGSEEDSPEKLDYELSQDVYGLSADFLLSEDFEVL